MGAPCAGVPLPGGNPVPSGMMLMSHGAMSFGSIGLPRLGISAAIAAPAIPAPSAMPGTQLRIDMSDLALRIHRPAGDRVEMLAGKISDRRRFGRLPAQRHELRARRLRIAAF